MSSEQPQAIVYYYNIPHLIRSKPPGCNHTITQSLKCVLARLEPGLVSLLL